MSETFFCATCSKYRTMDQLGIRKPGRGPVCKICVSKISEYTTQKPKAKKPKKTESMTRMPIPE